MQNRAYSLIEVKAIDEEQRIIEGIATTPTADRTGDIVLPEGAEYQLPIPFLWQHNSGQPIGEVFEAKVTKKGITFKARIAKDVTDTIEECWKMIKAGLVKGISIGFKALDVEDIPNSWSVIVKKWLWLELSAVTIAANGEATITKIKSLDREALAATGRKQHFTVRALQPPRQAKTKQPMKEEIDMGKKTIGEQIEAFEETRKKKALQMKAIMDEAGEKGETLSAEQESEYDDLANEIKTIDKHLDRLKDMEALEAKRTTVVGKKSDDASGSNSRDPAGTVIVRAKQQPKLEPGIRLTRYLKCMGIASKKSMNVLDVAAQLYKDDEDLVNTIKAAVVAGSTVSGTWANDLVGSETTAFADFVEYLRPRTIIGKFGTGGIPSLRRVPFRTALVSQVGGGSGSWVGEGKGKPLTAFDFNRTTLSPLKVANICVTTEELLRDSSPSAEALVRDQLVAALRERLDIDFIDPNKPASAGVSPAGILNGIAAIGSSGTDEAAVRVDVAAIMAAFIANNNAPTTGVWVMKETTALAISMMTNALGQTAFPGISMNGGMFFGLPVITSEYVGDDTGGAYIALINASDVYFADEGGFEVAMSREASLQMDDTPTQSSVASVTATSVVSMFQTNSVAFRAERTVNWARRRTGSVAWLNNVAYSAGS